MKKSVLPALILLAALGASCACGGNPDGGKLPEGEQGGSQQGGSQQGPTPSKPQKPTPAQPQYTVKEEEITEDANGARYSANSVTMRENSPLKGKLIYFLGSSVTYGAASLGESIGEYLAALTGCESVKEAVSGTTLMDNGANSYTRRMEKSNFFRPEDLPDAFICQISTNDCTNDRLQNRGKMIEGIPEFLSGCDRTTTLGAVEYIIRYVTDTWGCPVYFYAGAYFGDSGTRSNGNPKGSEYGKLVTQVKEIAEKWQSYNFDVQVIDMYYDEAFNNAVSDEYYKWCTSDAIHPKKAGYLNWWTPYLEAFLLNRLK